MMKIFPIIAGGALIYYLAMKRSAAQLNYYFKGFSLSFEGITPIIRITLAVQNVSNARFQVKGFTGLLYSGQKVIGNIYGFNPITIMPTSETLMEVKVRLSTIALVSDIVRKIDVGQGLNYQLSVVGSLNAEGFVIPVNFSFVI